MQRRTLLSALAMPQLAATALAAAPVARPAETGKVLLQRELPNAPGRTFTTLLVTFPPGARAAPHRHGSAFVYAYVLAGSVRSQVDERAPVVYQAGESWEELPGARHRITENVSNEHPAQLLAVFISTTGDPLKVPDLP